MSVDYSNFSNFFAKFDSDYPNYAEDKNFVYKYVYPNYFIVLEKIQQTKTNENRKHVVDFKHAVFRGSVFAVELILDMTNFKEIEHVVSYYYDEKTHYKVGHNVVPNDYDDDIENIDSFGISYFLSIEAAYFFGYMTVEFSIDNKLNKQPQQFKSWYPNGSLLCDGFCINESYVGKCVWYHDRSSQNESLIIAKCGTYDINKDCKSIHVGVWKSFYKNEDPETILTYNRVGELDGYAAEYSKDGKLREFEYCPKYGKRELL